MNQLKIREFVFLKRFNLEHFSLIPFNQILLKPYNISKSTLKKFSNKITLEVGIS